MTEEESSGSALSTALGTSIKCHLIHFDESLLAVISNYLDRYEVPVQIMLSLRPYHPTDKRPDDTIGQ